MRISDWSSDVCSSDLLDRAVAIFRTRRIARRDVACRSPGLGADRRCAQRQHSETGRQLADRRYRRGLRAAELRSEEHTSELQSLMRISYAVFCLKKKKQYHNITVTHIYTTTKQNKIYNIYITSRYTNAKTVHYEQL